MGRSARVLGREFGRTAAEMNKLLKEHGYLYGNPGAYGLTEKGQQFGDEQYHSRGTGGYAHYNPSWETRTWNDETPAALKADMEAADTEADPGGIRADVDDAPADEADDFEYEFYEDDDDSAPVGWGEIAIAWGVVGAALLAPHVKPIWTNKVKPATKKLREKFTQQGSAEAIDAPE